MQVRRWGDVCLVGRRSLSFSLWLCNLGYIYFLLYAVEDARRLSISGGKHRPPLALHSCQWHYLVRGVAQPLAVVMDADWPLPSGITCHSIDLLYSASQLIMALHSGHPLSLAVLILCAPVYTTFTSSYSTTTTTTSPASPAAAAVPCCITSDHCKHWLHCFLSLQQTDCLLAHIPNFLPAMTMALWATSEHLRPNALCSM